MTQHKHYLMRTMALVVIAAVILLAVCGCSSSPKLDKDASIKTTWGELVQYKIPSDWESTKNSEELDFIAAKGYEHGDDWIDVVTNNTKDRNYSRIHDDTTYSDWVQSQEEQHSGEAKGESSRVGTTIEYSDYKLEQTGTKEIDGVEFRLYEATYKYKAIDSQIADYDKSTQYCYYAVVKDGTHDLRIGSNNKAVFNSFLDTITIKW